MWWILCLVVLVAVFLPCSLDAIVVSPFFTDPSLASKAEEEYLTLKSFDEQIAHVDNRQKDHETISGQIALAILHHMRDDRWKQGGDWAALRHADRALQLLHSDSHRDTDSSDNFFLDYALSVHKARILMNLGQHARALELLEKVLGELYGAQKHRHLLMYAKELSTVLYMKADALLSTGNIDASIPVFVKSLELNACQHQAYYKLALALVSRKGNHSSALLQQQQLLRQRTNAALTRVTLKEMNQIVYRNGTKAVCAYFDTSDGFDVLQEHSDVVEMDALAIEARTSPEHKQRVIQSTFYWTLYLLADAEQDRDAAWTYLSQARFQDRFRLAISSVYSLENTVKAADHIKSFFKADYWPTRPSDWMGSGSKSPVFIVGFFRSGSTLLESLLDGHDAIWGMGENSAFTFQMHELQHDMMNIVTNGTEADKVVDKDNSYVTEFTRLIKQHSNVVVRKMKQRFKDFHPEYYDEAYRKEFGLTDLPTAPEVPITRIVDKMLLNYRNIALIHLVFPNAVILHMVRDPLDTLFSCLKNRFGDFSPYTLEYRSLVLEYIAYLEIVHHFRTHLPSIAYGPKQQRQAMIDVRYEALVANPEKVLTRIFTALDVQIPPSMSSVLHFHERGRHVRTASYLQVKEPIYHKSVGQWRKYAAQLQENLIPELKQHFKVLRESDALPFDRKGSATRMNWDMQLDFNYSQLLQHLAKDEEENVFESREL